MAEVFILMNPETVLFRFSEATTLSLFPCFSPASVPALAGVSISGDGRRHDNVLFKLPGAEKLRLTPQFSQRPEANHGAGFSFQGAADG